MPKLKDFTGQRFGKLLVIKRAENSPKGKVRWLCKCDCGGTAFVAPYDLPVQKYCNFCKPQRFKKTHGLSDTPEFIIWQSMKARCKDKNNPNYGGRGIGYCKRWENFENFLSDMGNRPNKKLTLERKDNNKGYSPENCVWATRKEQARNFRKNRLLELDGEFKCVSEWAEIYGLTNDLISDRINRGYSVKDAITKPKKQYKRLIMVDGVEMPITIAESYLGLGKGTISWRIKNGFPIDKVLSTKKFNQKQNKGI